MSNATSGVPLKPAFGASAPETTGDNEAAGDLAIFNRWLCLTRFRASIGVALFAGTLHLFGIGALAFWPILAVCAGLTAFSTLALSSPRLARAPRLFFHLQNVVDIAAVTVGIGAAHAGPVDVLLRALFFLIIIPASLISVATGTGVAIASVLAHGILLGLARGFSLATFSSIEFLFPTFLFFVVAQQAFFYGGHLKLKNSALARLAARLEEHRGHLAALVDVARTLNSTLDAPELLARVNRAALLHLGADWGATFLVNSERRTFRLAALNDAEIRGSQLDQVEFPIDSWLVVPRIAHERIVVLSGADAEQTSPLLTGGRRLSLLLIGGLYREEELVGFLALGFAGARHPALDSVLQQLGAIAEHAAIALCNAQLLDDARQASALKSEFLSTVSHELRTPLNVIIGYTEMLRDGASGQVAREQLELIQRIDARSHELLELLEATLHVGRIETGRDAVSLAPVEIRDLVEAIHAATAGLPRPPGVLFLWDRSQELDGTITTDCAKVALVVRNLVSNAFKFTAEGRVTLRMVPDDITLAIEVSDTGVGIAAEQVPVIFEMFRQLDNSPTREHGGVGLGLYIVKQVVSRLGGTVTVDSTLGRGSTFRVTLPSYAPADTVNTLRDATEDAAPLAARAVG